MVMMILFLSEVDFDNWVLDGFFVICLILDLNVMWENGGKNFLIIRLFGQIVFKIYQLGQFGEKVLDVLVVRWKLDGEQYEGLLVIFCLY